MAAIGYGVVGTPMTQLVPLDLGWLGPQGPVGALDYGVVADPYVPVGAIGFGVVGTPMTQWRPLDMGWLGPP